MAKRDAKKSVHELMLSGFRHHPREAEQKNLRLFLLGQLDAEVLYELRLDAYADLLAPERMRGQKNGLIALVAVISRAAIELGADVEQSFSASDYYIYTIETKKTDAELERLAVEIYAYYADLVQQAKHPSFSLPITRAIRYIRKKLYEPCSVSEAAAHVNLNAQYFSGLFKRETGVTPSRYIRNHKLEEAARLLAEATTPVSEISEMLGFCNVSYFAREFRKVYGRTPKQYVKNL